MGMTPEKIIDMCQRGVRRATPFGMLPYSYGFKILHNVMEYLTGSNPAPAGRLSWTAAWWAHYDAQEVLAMERQK
jgi:hypothetical protein